eukprot:10665317-Karenia_brevis.AAC.1
MAGLTNVDTEVNLFGHRADVFATGWGDSRSQILAINVTVANALAPSVLGSNRADQRELE